MIQVPTHRTPTHPGEMLQEEFLIPLGLTQRAGGRHSRPLSACQRPGPWTAKHDSQHRDPPGKVLWQQRRLLDEPATAVGSILCSTEGTGNHSGHRTVSQESIPFRLDYLHGDHSRTTGD